MNENSTQAESAARPVVVVDLETTGLNADHHSILEVAAVPLDPDTPPLRFVPHIAPADLHAADPNALAVSRYYERRLFREALTPAATAEAYEQLAAMLTDATLAGANPSFDAGFLARVLLDRPWHFRLLDLESFAVGAGLGELGRVPSLRSVCESVGITNTDPHTALGDADATARALLCIDSDTYPPELDGALDRHPAGHERTDLDSELDGLDGFQS